MFQTTNQKECGMSNGAEIPKAVFEKPGLGIQDMKKTFSTVLICTCFWCMFRIEKHLNECQNDVLTLFWG